MIYPMRVLYLFLISSQFGSDEILGLIPDSRRYIQVAYHILGEDAGVEYSLFLVGPGYGFLVAVFFVLFGVSVWPILILQITLSSLSCCLIYLIAKILLNDRPVSLVAGLLASISLTSISLSAAILTETLFFFLLVVSAA